MGKSNPGKRQPFRARQSYKLPSYYLLSKDKGQFQKDMARYDEKGFAEDERCMIIVSDEGKECGKLSRSKRPRGRRTRYQGCHTLSKKSVIYPLAGRNEKVVDFTWHIQEWVRFFLQHHETNRARLWSAQEFEPPRTGKGDATKFGFACNAHDNKAFDLLDKAAIIDMDDRALVFQAVHRTLLYSASQFRRVGWILNDDRMNALASFHDPNSEAVKAWEACKVNVGTLSERIGRERVRLGKLWLEYQDSLDEVPISLACQSVDFRSTLRFAACMLLDDVNVYAIILPYPDSSLLHQLTIIQVGAESETPSSKAARKLADVARGTQDAWIRILEDAFHAQGCVVASVDSYEKLKADERLQIKRSFRDGIQVNNLERVLQTKSD